MAAKEWRTIRIPESDYRKHNRRRKERGLSWTTYVDGQAPEYVTEQDVLREIVREEVGHVLADTAIEGLPEPEDLPPLVEKGGDACQLCGESSESPGRAIIHVLTEHAAEVNERHAETDRRRRDRGEAVEIDWAGSQNDDEPMTVNPDGPVSFGEIPTEKVGTPWNGTTPARECDGCGTVMSKSYTRVFATELGDMMCPDCAPRSVRYTNDPAYGEGSHSDPSTVTGSSNSQYRSAKADAADD